MSEEQSMLFGGDDGSSKRQAERKRNGGQLRDEGMAVALHNAGPTWQAKATEVVLRHRGRSVTGELIRQLCTDAGVTGGRSNAWGGFVCGLIKKGVLEPTGAYVRMKDPRSHARKTEVYLVKT